MLLPVQQQQNISNTSQNLKWWFIRHNTTINQLRILISGSISDM